MILLDILAELTNLDYEGFCDPWAIRIQSVSYITISETLNIVQSL